MRTHNRLRGNRVRGNFERAAAWFKPAFEVLERREMLSASLRSQLNATTVLDDNAADVLFGDGGKDWFFAAVGDSLLDAKPDEAVN